jgi:hypothetical protein
MDAAVVLWPNNHTAMNTYITRTAALIAVVLTLGQAVASGPAKVNAGTRTGLERALDRALNKNLSYPVLERGDMTGEVFVSFVIDKEGRVEVLECNSANERLREYVLRKLARIDIGANPDGIWRTTHMRISFKPERT